MFGDTINKDIDPCPHMAIRAADAFLAQAESFTDRLGPTINEAAEQAGNDLGGVIASATQMSLAAELYLKTSFIVNRLDVPHEHNLLTLYRGLPSSVREYAEARYDEENTFEAGPPSSIHLTIGGGAPPPTTEDVREMGLNLSYDLQAVLERSGDAFITWRYLYEKGERGANIHFEYEFGRLSLICTIIRTIITDGIT